MLKRPQAARLLAVDRDAPGTRLLLLTRDEATIGNAGDCALRVDDPNVAARQAVVKYSRGRYYVEDLKSGGDTFVNSKRIRRTQRLKHGDVLRFGNAPPYRFIDPDAQKRRRWRRNLRLAAVIAVLVAFGVLDHREGWGVVSVATLSNLVAMMESSPAQKSAALPAAVAMHASARATAPVAAATVVPHPASTAPATTTLVAAGPSSWIDRLNFYRTSNGLAPIHENADASAAAAAHAHYLLLNFGDDIRNTRPMSGDAYDEKPDKSGYSAAGAEVAPNLNLEWGCSAYDATQQIDRWIEAPFHRFAMLDPNLREAGFGQAVDGGCWVAALRLPPPPEEVKPYPRPIEFPPDGATVSLDWIGVEAPDPLASCPGYVRPVGLPITIQIGMRIDTKLTAHSLLADGKPIEHCIFDAPSYLNADPKGQEYGRWHLRNAGAIVIVPRTRLQPGVRYSVSIGAHDTTYAWSFTVASGQDSTFAAVAPFPTPAAEPTPKSMPKRVAIAPRAAPAAAASSEAEPTRVSPRHRVSRSRPAPVEAREAPVAAFTPAIVASAPLPADAVPPESGQGGNWLSILNLYRERLKLQPLEEDPQLSHGCFDHSKYLVTNYAAMVTAGINPTSKMHTEDETKPDYTPDGIKAARASDVMFQPIGHFTPDQRMARSIESWIAGPFHRAPLVNPQLRQVGFGEYCGKTICVAALDWRSDLPPATPEGMMYETPIEVPPDGATVTPSGFGNEWPSPVAPCPGYPNNAPAITLQIGYNVPASLGDASLTQTTGAAAGTKVATCAYDFQRYINPDPGTREHGRQVLKGFGEVVMMIRDPLIGGESYRVDMHVNGYPYTWSFTALK